MRLSEWRRRAPAPGALEAPVLDVLVPVLADVGADPDPECWIAWGEDPEARYAILVPVPAGLVTITVRPPVGSEDARVTAKVIRWPKLSLGEFSLDAAAGRRVIVVQVEDFIIKGVDSEADRICEFMRGLVIAADGRGPIAATPVAPAVVAGPSAAEIAKAVADALKRVVIPVAAAGATAPTSADGGGGRGGAAARGRGAGQRNSGAARPRPNARPRRSAAPKPDAVLPGPAAAEEPEPGSAAGVAVDAEEGEEILLATEPVEAEPGMELMVIGDGGAPSGGPGAAIQAEDTEEPEAGAEAMAESSGEQEAPQAAPRPRAPRKPRAESDEARAPRPRRVHREWPQPSAQPGWIDAHPIAEEKSKKRPRWIP